jgi:dienelactone hydrolase
LTVLALTATPTFAQSKHTQSAAALEFRKQAKSVTFESNGLTLHGWLYKPPGDGPFPAIIWNHGSEKDPVAHPELGQFYTGLGMVTFLPVRRGHLPSPGGYIVDEQDAVKEKEADPKVARKRSVELHDEHSNDVVAAVEWLRKQPFVDPNRLAMTGVSYGGIQTLIASEKDLGVRAFIPFCPAAMSWANTDLQDRLKTSVAKARAPLFLIQAKNDFSTGPSDVLGPLIRDKKGANRATLYPAFGTSPREGHGGFACWEEGIAIWGPDVRQFLQDTGVLTATPAK